MTDTDNTGGFSPDPSDLTRSRRSLAFLNFFLSDVRDGLTPYLAIFLLTERNWDNGSIGTVIAIMSISTLLAQTPVGAFVDATKRKRTLIMIAAIIVAAASVTIVLVPGFWPVAISKAFMGAAAAVFLPAIAAITLGIFGPKNFTPQVGRNEAWNHAGNVVAALSAGLVGWALGLDWVFYLVALTALAACLAVMSIPKRAIDDEVARGFQPNQEQETVKASGFKTLLESPPLVIFSSSILLFHFANAAMLPLAGEKLTALGHATSNMASVYMSACIVMAQIVMIPMAMLVGRKADRWGRRPIFLVAFLVLPIRGLLFTFIDVPYGVVAIQILDGIGAGIFGALFPIVLADLTRGTGRYNVTQGAVATLMGVGVALSNFLAGYIVEWAGYQGAFLFLAAVALIGLGLFFFKMPETRPSVVAQE